MANLPKKKSKPITETDSWELAALCTELKRRKEKIPDFNIATDSKFKQFQKTYRNDPLAFVQDCMVFNEGESLAPYQAEFIGNVLSKQREAMYGPRGLGKTSVVAMMIHWAMLTVDDCKIPTTASAWQQLTNFLWPEIRKWAGRIRWDRVGRDPYKAKDEMKAEELSINGDQCLAFAVASVDTNRIEGAHSMRRVMCVFDESKAIQDSTFDSSEGAFTKTQEPLAIAVSTPGPPIGRFYEICSNKDGKYSDWWVRHVTMEEQIKCGRMSADWAEKRRLQWGQDSALYKNHVLGEFAGDADGTVIPWHLIERAAERWKNHNGMFGPITALGVDVGGGVDPSAIALACGPSILEIREYDYRDTMETTGIVAGLLNKYPGATAFIDVIGLGSGVYYRLKEQGLNVEAVNSAAKSEVMDKSGELGYANCRAEMWWTCRERLEEEPSTIALPDDDFLKGELTAPKYKHQSNGKILIESKDEIRKRLGRSTNKADACLMALLGRDIGLYGDVEVTTVSMRRY